MTVRDGAAYEWEPVENNRRLVSLPEQELLENIQKDSENDEGDGGDWNQKLERQSEVSSNKQTHCRKAS